MTWNIVIDRTKIVDPPVGPVTFEEMPPIVYGPFATEAEAEAEAQSDSGVVYAMITIDCKKDSWNCDDVFWTVLVAADDAERIIRTSAEIRQELESAREDVAEGGGNPDLVLALEAALAAALIEDANKPVTKVHTVEEIAADLGIEPDQSNALRIIADYELMSDEPPLIWADIVFGHAKEHGLILDYEVLTTAGHYTDLTFLVFTVTVSLASKPFDPAMPHEMTAKVAEEFLTRLLNEPPSIRWVEGIQWVDPAVRNQAIIDTKTAY